MVVRAVAIVSCNVGHFMFNMTFRSWCPGAEVVLLGWSTVKIVLAPAYQLPFNITPFGRKSLCAHHE